MLTADPVGRGPGISGKIDEEGMLDPSPEVVEEPSRVWWGGVASSRGAGWVQVLSQVRSHAPPWSVAMHRPAVA